MQAAMMHLLGQRVIRRRGTPLLERKRYLPVCTFINDMICLITDTSPHQHDQLIVGPVSCSSHPTPMKLSTSDPIVTANLETLMLLRSLFKLQASSFIRVVVWYIFFQGFICSGSFILHWRFLCLRLIAGSALLRLDVAQMRQLLVSTSSLCPPYFSLIFTSYFVGSTTIPMPPYYSNTTGT